VKKKRIKQKLFALDSHRIETGLTPNVQITNKQIKISPHF